MAEKTPRQLIADIEDLRERFHREEVKWTSEKQMLIKKILDLTSTNYGLAINANIPSDYLFCLKCKNEILEQQLGQERVEKGLPPV